VSIFYYVLNIIFYFLAFRLPDIYMFVQVPN
jgi:hypothetical protein